MLHLVQGSKLCCSKLMVSSSFEKQLCISVFSFHAKRLLHIQKASLFTGRVIGGKLNHLKTMSEHKHNFMTNIKDIEFSVTPGGFLLVDDDLQIVLKGLERGQIITVHAVLTEEKKVYESCSTFQADNNGVVNMATQPSLSGTYTGVSSMGIFWSMVPAPGQQEGIRLMKKNLDTPFRTAVYTYNGELTLDDLHTGNAMLLNVSEIDRWYLGQGVSSETVRDGSIRGKLFMPRGSGPFPGVIDLFGTVGGLTEYRAALLASRGFAVLALPYFAYEDLPTNLMGLSLDYFLEAIDWVLSHKKIYSSSVGVVGVSKGGDIALMMGAYSPKVSAIVNINGCTFNSSVPLRYGNSIIPAVECQLDKMTQLDGIYCLNESLDYEEKDLIPVWNHNSKVLNILSEDDLCSPKECIRLMKRCYPTDKTDNFTILAYDKAGHLVEPPYTPLCRMSYHKSFGMYFMWGGTPKEHAAAQEDSWRNILTFLDKNIPKTMRDNSVKSKL